MHLQVSTFFKMYLLLLHLRYNLLFAQFLFCGLLHLKLEHSTASFSMDEGRIALNRCELLVQWLAVTKPPSFTQTNQWVLQAEEQSRNKSLDRMSMEEASVYYLYKADWVLEVRNVWRAVCCFLFHTTVWLIRKDIQDVRLIVQHRDNEPALEEYTVCWHVDLH